MLALRYGNQRIVAKYIGAKNVIAEATEKYGILVVELTNRGIIMCRVRVCVFDVRE